MADPVELRFDGQVVLITGAGRGLGREYALAFSERGASIVVNDLGGSTFGEGKSSKAADLVVNEICAKGGQAVASYDSVEEGDKIVQTALDAFGRIDIVVNNAGVLRDRTFANMSNDDWDIIHRIHLRGSFLVTKAAWPHMKKQKFGRVIMTASAAGLYGNFGQTNYSAAKLGLLGMSNALAIEGKKYNILCNTVAPMAASRLTEKILPDYLLENLKPEYIAPLVLYLCHESCTTTGGIFEAGARWMGKLRWERSPGVLLDKKNLTPESVKKNWEKISDFENSCHPSQPEDTINQMLQLLNDDHSKTTHHDDTDDDSSGGINRELAMSFISPPVTFTYTYKDVILFALGVGQSTNDPEYLNFLYEGADNFMVLPAYAAIPAQMAVFEVMGGGIPGLQFDVTKVLHGEHYTELYRPLSSSGTLTSVVKVADVLDKGSGAVMLFNVDTFNENKEMVAFNQFSVFVVGAGNFGGPRTSDQIKPLVKPPARTPDLSNNEQTSVNQGALYRLAGDYNPLHIDPKFAALAGFGEPVLHGLCVFGYGVRNVLKHFANNNVSKIKTIKARFSKPTIPGQTIRTDMWKEGNGVHFQCQVVENGNICISGGFILLDESTHKRDTISLPIGSEVFGELSERLKNQPQLAKKTNGVFLWNITKNGQHASSWTVDLKTDGGAIYYGEPKTNKADCILTIEDENFVALATENLDPQQIVLSGKLQVKGDILLSQQLFKLFKQQAKL